jgi:hypothetical protein
VIAPCHLVGLSRRLSAHATATALVSAAVMGKDKDRKKRIRRTNEMIERDKVAAAAKAAKAAKASAKFFQPKEATATHSERANRSEREQPPPGVRTVADTHRHRCHHHHHCRRCCRCCRRRRRRRRCRRRRCPRRHHLLYHRHHRRRPPLASPTLTPAVALSRRSPLPGTAWSIGAGHRPIPTRPPMRPPTSAPSRAGSRCAVRLPVAMMNSIWQPPRGQLHAGLTLPITTTLASPLLPSPTSRRPRRLLQQLLRLQRHLRRDRGQAERRG